MKYTLYVNQPLAISLGIENINQAIIFDMLTTASTWTDPEIIEGEVYYWVSRTVIADELKLLNLKEDTVYRHLRKLDDLGLIKYKKSYKKDCIKITEKGKKYISKNTENTMSEINPSDYVGNKSEFWQNSEINPRKLGNKSENSSEINPTYHTTNNNHTTNDNIAPLDDFNFTLSKKYGFNSLSSLYKQKLKDYILQAKKSIPYEEFESICLANGYTYKNFKLAYDNWVRKDEKVKGDVSLDRFKKDIKERYRGKNIANRVPNYLKETIIAISDSGYVINTANNKSLQGTELSDFWEWLYQNQNRVGDVKEVSLKEKLFGKEFVTYVINPYSSEKVSQKVNVQDVVENGGMITLVYKYRDEYQKTEPKDKDTIAKYFKINI